MTCRSFVRILTVCAAAAGAALLSSPAAACQSGPCEVSAQSAEAKPLKLNAFRRKPVATSATRTVKKQNGEYATVSIKRRAKPPVAAAPMTPENLSPAAAQAFASYELARVRVVMPEETSGAGLLADTVSSNVPIAVIGVDSVEVVNAEELNDIDRKADSPSAVSLDALSRKLEASAELKADGDSWLQRMLMVLGGAFAAVAALVRMLLA